MCRVSPHFFLSFRACLWYPGVYVPTLWIVGNSPWQSLQRHGHTESGHKWVKMILCLCAYSTVSLQVSLLSLGLMGKKTTQTERKSPLFDGYKQAGKHSIVIFWYSTYNSKLGHWGQPPRFIKQKTVQSIHASSKTLTLALAVFFFNSWEFLW